jgi:hypothetical protein
MDDGSGSLSMELQARKVAENLTNRHAPCPTCGVVISPIEYMYNKGLCYSCFNDKLNQRIKRKMA